MSKQPFPIGWDEARVQRLIDHYENMSDDDMIAEDEAAHKAGKDQMPVQAVGVKVNGKIKGSGRQKKGKQPKVTSRSKPRKAKRVSAKPAFKG